MSEELAQKTLAELSPLIKSREVSPVEVTNSVLNRVEKYDPVINAYIEVNRDKAIASAKSAEREIIEGNYRGALHGIPLALKDILHFKDENVTFGSKIHKNHIGKFDATVVSKLKNAGVVFTGKLNMHEYAWGGTTNNPHFGPCRNPWDLDKIPGGSSGGSGAAVAADMTIVSLGTDTGGSIRMPAAACGIVGLKPTHGLVSKYGCFPLSWSLDHIGPMTKTVEDAAVFLEFIAGFDEKDPTTVNRPHKNYASYLTGDIKGKVIGIEEDYFFNDVNSDVERLVKEGIKQLESLGARVELIKIPSLKYSGYISAMTVSGEGGTIHQRNIKTRFNDYGKDVQDYIKTAYAVSATDYLEAQQLRRVLAQEFAQVFEKVDVIIAPSLHTLPPMIGDDVSGGKLGRFSSPANITGLPAISVPCGISEGLPVGMQIIGPAFKEEEVLNFAYTFEKTNPLQGVGPVIEKALSKNIG